MIEKKSFDKETIQICSYDISKKERTKSNPRLHLVYPSLYQSDKFVLLESEALWFYIYENIYEELIVHIDYQQSDVAFNLFKKFKRLILYKRYIKCKGKEEKKRFSSLIFDEDLDMRIMSSIEEEDRKNKR